MKVLRRPRAVWNPWGWTTADHQHIKGDRESSDHINTTLQTSTVHVGSSDSINKQHIGSIEFLQNLYHAVNLKISGNRPPVSVDK